MNKTVIYVVLALILGSAIGAFAMLLAFPFLFPPAEVNETIADLDSKTATTAGRFIHPDPDDRLHWGKGGVTVYAGDGQYEVLLEDDFEVGPGPDYYVYLSDGAAIRSNADFENAANTSIGRLKSFSGSQVYAVPAGVDFDSARSVVVWCRTFSMLITSAELNAP